MTEPTKLSPEEKAREWCQRHIAEWWYWNSATREKYLTSVIAYASHVSAADKARIAELEEVLEHLLEHTEHKGSACKLLAVGKASALLEGK